MIYHLAQYVMLVIGELLFIRAMCILLHMRNDRIYALVALVSAVGFRIIKDFLPARVIEFMPFQIVHLTMAVFFMLVFPVLYSVGPLPTRIIRSSLANLSLMLSDAAGGVFYSLVSSGAYRPAEVNENTIAPVLFVYALIIPINALALEATIKFCTREDRSDTNAFSLPFLALIGVSVALFTFVDERVFATNAMSTLESVLCLVHALLGIVIGYAMIYVTQRDVAATRAIADRAAAARQIKHLRYQVETTTLRSLHVRRLRHDLANQVDVVHELVAEGRPHDADRYLATLQEQARRLGGKR